MIKYYLNKQSHCYLCLQNLFVMLMYLKDGNEDVVLQSGDTVFYNYTISPFDINRY